MAALYARRQAVEALDLGPGLNPYDPGGLPDYALHDELFGRHGYAVPEPYSQCPNVSAVYREFMGCGGPVRKRRRITGKTSPGGLVVAMGGG